MSEPLTKEQIVERGRRAQALLDNELLRESVEKLKAYYLEQWAKSEAGDVTGRERLFVAYGLVDQVYAHLRVLVADGSISAQQLARLKRQQ